MVSIIVPVYNVEQYIDKCMESLINQTYKDIEIILIDDGSLDSSGEKCMEWAKKDSRIIYISKKNEGLGPTRNLGINAASGEYLAFVDSDDWVSPDFVEIMARSAANSGADIIICDIYDVNNTSKEIIIRKQKVMADSCGEAVSNSLFLQNGHTSLCCGIYKKPLFTKNNIYMANIYYEDFIIHPLLAACADKIIYVKTPLYFYRTNRQGGIMAAVRNRQGFVKALEQVYDCMLQKMYLDKYYEPLKKMIIRHISYALREISGLTYGEQVLITNGLYAFLDGKFPGWKTPHSYRLAIMGSNNLYCMTYPIIADMSRAVRVSYDAFSQYGRFDYVIIDFLQDRFTENYPQACNLIDQMIADVNNNYGKKIIVVKNYFAEYYGEYAKETCFFDIQEIKNKNHVLKQLYDYAEGKYPYIKFADFSQSPLYFADKSSRHGCSPFHLNDFIFIQASDVISSMLAEGVRRDG